MRLKRPWLSPTKPPQSDTSTARVVYLGATQHGTARKKVVTARSQHHVQCWRAVGAVAASHHTHPRRRSHLATELLKEPPLIPYATPRHSIDHAMPAQVPSSRLAARTRERPALRSDAAITAGGARRGGGRGGGERRSRACLEAAGPCGMQPADGGCAAARPDQDRHGWRQQDGENARGAIPVMTTQSLLPPSASYTGFTTNSVPATPISTSMCSPGSSCSRPRPARSAARRSMPRGLALASSAAVGR